MRMNKIIRENGYSENRRMGRTELGTLRGGAVEGVGWDQYNRAIQGEEHKQCVLYQGITAICQRVS